MPYSIMWYYNDNIDKILHDSHIGYDLMWYGMIKIWYNIMKYDNVIWYYMKQ